MPNNKNERKGKQAGELSAEERFRNFFSPSVIDLPEEMTRRDEEKKEKSRGVLGRLLGHGTAKEELQEANVELEQKPIGVDALGFIVNEDNPVQALTQQQLRDIYAGKITNWKDVGGKDQEIVAFQRGEDSGSQTLFKKLLIQGGELMTPPSELAPAAMGELVDSIADYNNSANAIGFSVYYYIDQMYSKPGLRLLAVDGVTPSNDTLADGSYPLCNDFYAVIHPDAAADSPERQLYDWLDTADGIACIQKAGYVPAQSAAKAD